MRAADAEGRIPDAVWKNLTALDVLVRGIQGDNGDTREKYFAVEASAVIDASDVQHAEERAGYLRDVGYDVAPWVAGRRILDAAQTLADERGVGVIILDPPSGA
ncbi:MAG: hypothetical protein IT303_12885 [Dehalococcoidia bacterium]|nr:hypothetical protein [Dehalococcoidia bacterium]